MSEYFITLAQAAEYLRGKTVAVVGSAPSCLNNAPGFIDAHDVVVRVNNFKLGTYGSSLGIRVDVHYSFYGTSIRTAAAELKRAGTFLCMCKCPNAKALESEWHERTNRPHGIDYRYIYKNRAAWWFCPTYVPTVEEYRAKFNMLQRHIPTTGFAAILDILACAPRHVYITGFDFFTSGRHNVDEVWRPGNPEDPICHRPDLEAEWLFGNAARLPVTFDAKLLALQLEMKRARRARTAAGVA